MTRYTHTHTHAPMSRDTHCQWVIRRWHAIVDSAAINSFKSRVEKLRKRKFGYLKDGLTCDRQAPWLDDEWKRLRHTHGTKHLVQPQHQWPAIGHCYYVCFSIIPTAGPLQITVISMYVCLSVCLSVPSRKPRGQTSHVYVYWQWTRMNSLTQSVTQSLLHQTETRTCHCMRYRHFTARRF